MTNSKSALWILIVIVLIGVVLYLIDFGTVSEQSEEARLMSEACEDIKAHEILRAETDFDGLLQVMDNHLHSYRDQSDTIVLLASREINTLRDEAVFRNTDQEYYNSVFSKVLIQLAYLELEDAASFLEEQKPASARAAIQEAKHYAHDAMIFSNEPLLTMQLNLLHQINQLNEDQLKIEDLQSPIREARKMI